MKHLRLFLLLFLGIMTTGCGLTNQTILYFNDGKEIKGYGKRFGENAVKFKTKDSKAHVFHISNLKKVVIYEYDTVNTYLALKIRGKDGYKVVKQVVEGPVSLYEYYTTVTVPGGVGMNTMSYTFLHYLIKREDGSHAIELPTSNNYSKEYKYIVYSYLNDCPSLMEKVSNNEFRKKDLSAVIRYYNEKCQ